MCDNHNETITADNQISTYLHCGECLKEKPDDISPANWARINIGWTKYGLQVWCQRHNCNIMNIDFEGNTHPAIIYRNEVVAP